MATVKKIVWEREECHRCGGTGHYSYNQIDGTLCYGCYGKKMALTKAGKDAVAIYKEMGTVLAPDLKVGDTAWADCFWHKGHWGKVVEAEWETESHAKSGTYNSETKQMEYTDVYYFNVRLQGEGKKDTCNFGMLATSKVRIPVDINKAAERLQGHPGATIIKE